MGLCVDLGTGVAESVKHQSMSRESRHSQGNLDKTLPSPLESDELFGRIYGWARATENMSCSLLLIAVKIRGIQVSDISYNETHRTTSLTITIKSSLQLMFI
jgi:hypothetical protein